MSKKLLLISIILCFSLIHANILYVPGDAGTIQAAINVAVDGDTVVASDDVYNENLNFLGKNITVGSRYLIDKNVSHISATIIDGNQNGSVITFANNETKEAQLVGLTIRNGLANDGGGIYCIQANPTLKNLVITNNEARSAGGGVYLYESSAILTNSTVSHNISESDGGGLMFYNSSGTLYRIAVFGNTSKTRGGGICGFNNSIINLKNVTVVKNTAYENGSGIASLWESEIDILNSIIWDNNQNGVYKSETGELAATYSDIMNGNDKAYFGEGCINLYPEFENVALYDFNLTPSSPCVDGGNPADIYFDPDGTIADMGAFYIIQTGIRGYVTVSDSSVSPTEVSIIISGDTSLTVYPNENGIYFVKVNTGTYDIEASAKGYLSDPPGGYQDINITQGDLVMGFDFEMSPLQKGQIRGRVRIEGLGDVLNVLISAGDESVHPYYDSEVNQYFYQLPVYPGLYDVEATLTGYQDSIITDVLVTSNRISDGHSFGLKLISFESFATGKVTLKKGNGVITEVGVTDGEDTSYCNIDGIYVLRTKEGYRNITAFLKGYNNVTQSNIAFSAADTTRNIDFVLIDWEVIEGNQYDMIVYSTTTYDGLFINDTLSNQFAAFGPDSANDIRGIGVWKYGSHPTWNTEFDSLFYELKGYWWITIVSNNNSGFEPITFKFFNTETDSIYDCEEGIFFRDTTYTNGINIHVPSPEREMNFSLIENWNWVSFNVRPQNYSLDNVFDQLTPNDITRITHENSSAWYNSVGGLWEGEMSTTGIKDGEGYLINLNNSVNNFTFSGQRYNPIIKPIHIWPGFNWVGYYPKKKINIGKALESITEEDTVIIFSQNKSAVFIEGWAGDLTELNPGEAYKIKILGADSSKFLIYPFDDNSPMPKMTIQRNFAGWRLMEGTGSSMNEYVCRSF